VEEKNFHPYTLFIVKKKVTEKTLKLKDRWFSRKKW